MSYVAPSTSTKTSWRSSLNLLDSQSCLRTWDAEKSGRVRHSEGLEILLVGSRPARFCFQVDAKSSASGTHTSVPVR